CPTSRRTSSRRAERSFCRNPPGRNSGRKQRLRRERSQDTQTSERSSKQVFSLRAQTVNIQFAREHNSLNSNRSMQIIREIGLVPVIRTSSAETAMRAVEAVCEGGIQCVEITMTVDRAIYALEQVANKYGDKVLLGAG